MVPAPALHVPEEAVRRWHELVQRRAALRPSRCSCGCRCADSGSRAASRVDAAGPSHDLRWRRSTWRSRGWPVPGEGISSQV